MPDMEEILAEAVARIRDAVQPERVILFGSHARDEAGSRSDIDPS